MVDTQLIVLGVVFFCLGLVAVVRGVAACVIYGTSLPWPGVAWMAGGGLALIYGLSLMFLVPQLVP